MTTRLREIDSLRGIAAMSVVAFHYTSYYHAVYGHSAAMPWRFSPGAHGVKLFFVLSGFVILATLRRCERLVDFARARFLRLYPVFWAAMIPSYLATIAELPDRVVGPLDLAANLTMIPVQLGFRAIDGVYWTLAVELAFYVCTAVLHRARLLAPERLPWTLAAWLVLAILWRRVLGPGTESSPSGVAAFALVLPHVGEFAVGMILFELHREARATPRHAALLLLAGASTLVWQSRGHVAYLVLCGSVVSAALFLRPALLRSRALLFLGALSYGIYLLHQNVGFAILHAGYRRGLPPSLGMAVATAVVVALAWVLHRTIELPSIALASRLRSPRSGEVAREETRPHVAGERT